MYVFMLSTFICLVRRQVDEGMCQTRETESNEDTISQVPDTTETDEKSSNDPISQTKYVSSLPRHRHCVFTTFTYLICQTGSVWTYTACFFCMIFSHSFCSRSRPGLSPHTLSHSFYLTRRPRDVRTLINHPVRLYNGLYYHRYN